MCIANRLAMPPLPLRPALPGPCSRPGVLRPGACLGLLLLLASGSARAASEGGATSVVPAVPRLPQMLSLDEALRIFRNEGLDLLIAEANVRNAEGGILIASALPNPVLSGGAGYAITYANNAFSRSQCLQNGAQCSSWTNNIGVNDSAALETILSGKRDLRLKVARNALAAAKLSRVDAERTIAFQVKATYLQVARGHPGLRVRTPGGGLEYGDPAEVSSPL